MPSPMEMLPMIKMMTQSLFIQFRLAFFLAQQYMRTTAIGNNLILTTRRPGVFQFKFLPTNLNVQAGRNSVFLF